MPSFEISKLHGIGSARALSETDQRLLDARLDRSHSRSGAAAPGGIEVEIGGGLDTASPPVDGDRVAQIREALRDGSYPLVPTKIADDMIAAQMRAGIRS